MYFQLKCLVLFHLAAKETTGHYYFFCHALGREQVYILELVFAARKVLHLHKTFVHEGFEAVVETAHADA